MTFNDKFKFLMDITNTNNTTLAGAVGIDNSAVSLYRSGKRKCPRNKEILRRMSDYFASSIKLSYQRKALALASDYSRFNHSRPLPEYSDMLYQWLADELPQTNTLVDGILNENISSSGTNNIMGIKSIDVIPNATSILYIFLPLKTMVQYMYGLMMMFTVYLIIKKFLILYRSFCSD